VNLDNDSPLYPSSHARLVYYGGLSNEQAFDVLAERAAEPACQAMIADWRATPQGRALLADVRASWDRENLPCPFECYLDLTPA